MRKASLWIFLCCSACTLAVLAFAQGRQKPGLWDVTTTMTWQKSPFPAEMVGNPVDKMSQPHTTQVCVTRDMIDKYGGPLPQTRNHECQAQNVKMRAGGMTADWICNGAMNGKGTVESTWTDENHISSKVHFTGTMQLGPQPTPVEYTTEMTSVYKSADCGSVKPVGMPK